MYKLHPYDCGHMIIGGYYRGHASENTLAEIRTEVADLLKQANVYHNITQISGTFLKEQDNIRELLEKEFGFKHTEFTRSKYHTDNPIAIYYLDNLFQVEEEENNNDTDNDDEDNDNDDPWNNDELIEPEEEDE